MEKEWSRTRSSSAVKNEIIKKSLLPYNCAQEGCNIKSEWLGKKISLHLDHINGDNRDHRLDNLRFLCPNCHSQTPTYCANNNKEKYTEKNKKVSDDDLLLALRNSRTFGQAFTLLGMARAKNYRRARTLALNNDIKHLIDYADFWDLCKCGSKKIKKNIYCSQSCRRSYTRALSEQDELKLVEMRDNGMEYMAIGLILNVKPTTASSIYKRIKGYYSYSKRGKAYLEIDGFFYKGLDMKIERTVNRKSIRQISEEIGVTESKLRTVLKHMGLEGVVNVSGRKVGFKVKKCE